MGANDDHRTGEAMNIGFRKMIPYWQVDLLLFYLSPFLIRDTGSGAFVLMGLIPVGCLITAAIYGAKQGFHVFYGVLVALSFLPSVWIFYNSSALIYSAVYGVLAIVGDLIGAAIYRPRKS